MFVRAEILGWLTALGALAGCASVAPPQGGPRDTVPPHLVSSSPDSAARNVHQPFIRLVFSEDVQTKDLSKNLLITPQLAADNSYKLREDHNAVTLLFAKPLDENTTYSFNFRDAVVDITESLPAKNAALSFSTGPTLDQGRASGTVTDLLSAAPAAGLAVGLYREADTAGVRRGRPYYLVQSDKEGKFSFNFLKTGRYKLYALADKNNNGRYDDGEKIAYLSQPVTISDSTAAFALTLTRPDRRPPLVSTQPPKETAFRVGFNEGVQTVVFKPLTGAAPAAAVAEAVLLTDLGRTATVFRTAATPEGRYLLTATDSTGNVAHDTLQVRFAAPVAVAATATARRAAAAPLYAIEGAAGSVYRQGQVRFRFAVPVNIADQQPFGTLMEDSVKSRPLRLPADGRLSPDHTLLTVQLATKAQKQLDILLDSTAVLPITGQALHPKPLRLRPTDQATTGTLSGTITTKEKHFELQLLDNKLQVVGTLLSPKGNFKFDDLAPGAYRLRVLVDADGDGRWRGPDPELQLLPEPVYLDPKVLQIRANWEVEEKLAF